MLEKRTLSGDHVGVRSDRELALRDDRGCSVSVGSAVFVLRVVLDLLDLLDFLVVRAVGVVSAVGIVDGDLSPRDRGAGIVGGVVKSSDGLGGSSTAEIQPVLRVAATESHTVLTRTKPLS